MSFVGMCEETLHHQCCEELSHLGLIGKCATGNYELTAFGEDVVWDVGDFRGRILSAVCRRFDLGWHGRIAAAFLQTRSDCFATLDFADTCGLYPEQLQSAHPARCSHIKPHDAALLSDMHSAIHEYLRAAAEDRVPETQTFRAQCFAAMDYDIARHSDVGLLTAGRAAALLLEPQWEDVLSLATAWAFQQHIAWPVGLDVYRTALYNTDPTRVRLLPREEDFQHVHVGTSSVQHSLNTANAHQSWIVFTHMLRHPNVGGSVPLSQDVAALCTRHPLTWPPSCSKELALIGFRAFLNSHCNTELDLHQAVIHAVRPGCDKHVPQPDDDESDASDGDSDEGQQRVTLSQSFSASADASSVSGSIRLFNRGFASHMCGFIRNIATQQNSEDPSDDEDLRSCIDELRIELERYTQDQASAQAHLLVSDVGKVSALLAAERQWLTDFLAPMTAKFGVSYKRTRRWLRSCESPVKTNLKNSRHVTGVFTAEIQAGLLMANELHNENPNDKTLAILRKQLPQSLLQPVRWKPRRAPNSIADELKGNKDKQKRHEALQGKHQNKDRLKKARQTVTWCDDEGEWICQWVTHQEVTSWGSPQDVEKVWKDWCWDRRCKQIDGSLEPLTQAEAFAAWLNQGYSWDSCKTHWDSYAYSRDIPDRQVDDGSKKRLRTVGPAQK